MGYYPKHLKVQRHKRNVLLVVHAALAGAMFERSSMAVPTSRYALWMLHYPNGHTVSYYVSRVRAAKAYLQAHARGAIR